MSAAGFLERRRWFDHLDDALKHHPVVVLLGPRQCGKTTLARQVAERRKAHWFDLEVASRPPASSSRRPQRMRQRTTRAIRAFFVAINAR